MMDENNIFHCRCRKCGFEEDVEKHSSVNAVSEPAARLGILDGSLMRWTCPSCGDTVYLEYPLLYHDPRLRFMVWLLPSGECAPEIREYGKKLAVLLPDYRCRKVDNILRLAEKIQIFEQGASDVAVELSELVFRQESGLSGNIFCHGLRFEDGTCREFRISVVKPGGEHEYYSVSPNIYTDCSAIVERNPDMQPGPGFVTVDYKWIASKLN